MTCPVMQFGTSRFLQAHVDLFVSEALGSGEAAGPICVVQTTGSPESRRRIEGFRALRPYPVQLRGMADGQIVERTIAVGSVAEAWHAADDWPAIVARFVAGTRFVVCNTGDGGWRLDPADHAASAPPRSFPAKLLHLLQARFDAGGAPLVVMPCELVSGNGAALRAIAVDLARAQGRAAGFVEWLDGGCVWVNSLVDRIVSEALEPVGAVAEPYALWAIGAGPGVQAPCRHADVRIVADLLPYERLKLFILNLGHTVLAERWLAGRPDPAMTVAAAIADPAWRAPLDAIYADEVLPVFATLGMAAEAARYRDTVMDRFANPFLRHRLADIAQNHHTKKQRRIGKLLELGREGGASAAPMLAAILESGIAGA